MKKKFVTLETAKLLKEKGFNEDCKTFFIDKKGSITKRLSLKNEDLPESCYSRPSQSLAQKWLRGKHGMEVSVAYCRNSQCGHNASWYYWAGLLSCSDEEVKFGFDFKSYEEALEEGIREALKFI